MSFDLFTGFLLLVVAVVGLLYWRSRRAKTEVQGELEETQGELEGTRGELEQSCAELAALKERFAGVVSADEEEAHVRATIAEEKANLEALRSSYQEKKGIYDRLLSEIAMFDEKFAFAELGVYEPHFDFTDSEEYKERISQVRELQKKLIADKKAVLCATEWAVEGSKAKGRTMINRSMKLALRAFNNECDAAIANTRWNNVNAMEKRIGRAHEQIDKLNASLNMAISSEYVELKMKELFLTHEYREKLKVEREERAEMARLQREEQKLLRDLEEAQEQERHYEALLEKARSEAAQIVGPQISAFHEQIAILEKDLEEAHAKAERAKAMAEKTKSGYVYIISNMGSFGDGVVKIGLTRRLDPLDRVRELGDASVPFTFDTHAIIYSDDAPALERALHAEFEETRINAQNMRKEFFRASIEQVEVAVQRLAPQANFFRDVEAQEYRETLSRRQQQLEAEAVEESTVFPHEL